MSFKLPDIPFDSLSQGEHYEFSYMSHPLVIRVNQWGEVEHIGYSIFDTSITHLQQSVVYDFVERYLLDLDISNEPDKYLRMGIDKFLVEVGHVDDVFGMKGDVSVEVSYVDYKRYRVAWKRDGNDVLSFMFDMDYQMLSGCNAIELERRYLQEIERVNEKPLALQKMTLPDSIDFVGDSFYFFSGGSYLVSSIRADQYYAKNSTQGWHLICSSDQPYKSAANVMLSASKVGDFMVQAKLDMYGYQRQDFTIDLAQWVAHTMAEGCQVYFGIKSRTPKTIRGTLFCPNPACGYCHMLSVEIPIESFDKKKGIIEAKMFAYIPLHNIWDGYFDLQYTQQENYSK